jgi:hypothetical protein
MPQGNDTLAVTLAITLALGAVLVAVLVALVPPRTEASAADPRANCAEWTDGCVLCIRTPQGASCSTPGIACTRSALRCLRR